MATCSACLVLGATCLLCARLAASIDIPAWPQLPRRSFHESMYVQYSPSLPAIVLDVFGGSFADIGLYRGLLAAGLRSWGALLLAAGHAWLFWSISPWGLQRRKTLPAGLRFFRKNTLMVDTVIMRFVDVMLCFPSFFLILTVVALVDWLPAAIAARGGSALVFRVPAAAAVAAVAVAYLGDTGYYLADKDRPVGRGAPNGRHGPVLRPGLAGSAGADGAEHGPAAGCGDGSTLAAGLARSPAAAH
jgi:hypothetical protein